MTGPTTLPDAVEAAIRNVVTVAMRAADLNARDELIAPTINELHEAKQQLRAAIAAELRGNPLLTSEVYATGVSAAWQEGYQHALGEQRELRERAERLRHCCNVHLEADEWLDATRVVGDARGHLQSVNDAVLRLHPGDLADDLLC